MFATKKISEDESLIILSRKRSLWSRKARKSTVPPKRVELVYLPFYLFEIEWMGKEGVQQVTVALDGLLGDNLFFITTEMLFQDNVDADLPVCPFVLSRPEAQRIAMERCRWQRLEQGLRFKQKSSVGKIIEVKKVFYPFWVGYFKRRGKYDFRIIDALSGEFQGVRMRRLFLAALRQLDSGEINDKFSPN